MMSHTKQAPEVRFVIQNMDGKGKGMIATQDIKQGDLIYAEEPLITVNRNGRTLPQIEAQLSALSASKRALFFDLAYQANGSTSDIFRTNSISNACVALQILIGNGILCPIKKS
eukprot:143919_1